MSTNHIKLYTNLLSNVYNGVALWQPDQGHDEDLKRLPHVRTGDVGYVDEDGAFVRFFNLHLGKDDPDQGIAVPEEYAEPLPDSSRLSFEEPRTYHVRKKTTFGGSGKAAVPVSPVNVGGSMLFKFEHKTSAILGFFDTGVQHKSPQVMHYEKEFIKNGSGWLRAAQLTVRSDLDYKDLKLVTHCFCVQSWVRGIIENKNTAGEFLLSVGVDPVSAGAQVSRTVEYQGNGNINHGPGDRIKESPRNSIGSLQNSSRQKEKAPESTAVPQPEPSASPLSNTPKELLHDEKKEIVKWSDQCIFIRSYRMQLRHIWQLKLRAGAGPHYLPKANNPDEDVSLVRNPDKEEDGQESADYRQEPSPSQLFDEPRDLLKDKEEKEREENSWDHMDTVFDYIFQRSDADFALVHEDDLLVYAKFFPAEVLEGLTADLVLRECHPTVTVQDFNGVKVGLIAKHSLYGYNVAPVAFSPDGKHIVSGFQDKNVQLWDAKTGGSIGEPLQGHTDSIASVAFSPDGKLIVSGSWDKTVRLWNAETGAPIGEPLQGHTDNIASVTFSPNGKHIVSGSWDKTVRLWNAETGAPIGGPLQGHTDSVASVAFSPDGRHIVSGSWDKTVQLWNAETGVPIGEPLQGHTDNIASVAFSSNGKCIVSGSWDKTVRLWNTETGAPIGEPLQWHTDQRFTYVAFSPNGRCMVSGSWDGTIQLWSTETGSSISEPLQGHTNSVASAAFSPDGKCIVSGSTDETVRLWNTETGTPIGEPLQGHSGGVASVAFSHNGKHIVSGSTDNTVRLWNAETGAPIGEPLQGHTDNIASVAFSPNGKRVVSGSWDNTVQLWNAKTGAPIGKPLLHTGGVTSVAFSPDGKHIVSGSWDKTVWLWNAETGALIGEPLQGHTDNVASVAFSPDGKYIVSGSWDKTIRLWNAETGAPIGEPLQGHTDNIASVAFSTDGKHIVSGTWDKTIRLWNTKTGAQISGPMQGHTENIASVAFSDREYVVSGTWDKTIRLWNAKTGALTVSFTSVAFSPDSKLVASGSLDGTIQLWNAETGAPMNEPLQGHMDNISSIAFSPDGKYIVSGSWDKTVQLWDIKTGAPIGEPLQGHTDNIASVAFSPDGKCIVSGSSDKTVRLWNAETGAPIGKPLQGHTEGVATVAFFLDGKSIVSGSWDKTVQLWNAETGAPIGEPIQGHMLNVASVVSTPESTPLIANGMLPAASHLPFNLPPLSEPIPSRALQERHPSLDSLTNYSSVDRDESPSPSTSHRSTYSSTSKTTANSIFTTASRTTDTSITTTTSITHDTSITSATSATTDPLKTTALAEQMPGELSEELSTFSPEGKSPPIATRRGKTVRFSTPSPSYSTVSLPETDGSLSPPSIAAALLPAVDCQLCPVLVRNRSTHCPIAWDMSFPVETARLHPAWAQSYWSAPATNPMVANLIVTFGTWRIVVHPSRSAYVTVLDVIHGIYRFLRGTSSERDFKSLSVVKQKRVEKAYNQRWQRCHVPAEREMERRRGVKHIDFLAESKYFWGLTPTKELGVWQLQVARS